MVNELGDLMRLFWGKDDVVSPRLTRAKDIPTPSKLFTPTKAVIKPFLPDGEPELRVVIPIRHFNCLPVAGTFEH